MIRCPMCFGEGSISETETTSKSRAAEIQRHKARKATEQARKDTEEQLLSMLNTEKPTVRLKR